MIFLLQQCWLRFVLQKVSIFPQKENWLRRKNIFLRRKLQTAAQGILNDCAGDNNYCARKISANHGRCFGETRRPAQMRSRLSRLRQPSKQV